MKLGKIEMMLETRYKILDPIVHHSLRHRYSFSARG
jgi:hypothetical protein